MIFDFSRCAVLALVATFVLIFETSLVAIAQTPRPFEIVRQSGHTNAVSSVAYSADGRLMASGSQDGTLRLWDAESGRLLRAIRAHIPAGEASSGVTSVAFSSDGRQLLSGGDDRMRLWDTASGDLLRTKSSENGWVQEVAFSPDGRYLLSVSDEGTMQLWDAASWKALRTFSGQFGRISSVAFSPDGSHVISAGDDSMLRLWNVASGRLSQTFSGHTGRVLSVAFSPDGTRVISGGDDALLRLWDVASGKPLRVMKGHKGRIHSVAFSRDGKRLLTGGGFDDYALRLWDAASGKLLRTLQAESSAIESVAFSTDGSRLLSGSQDGTLRVWDAEDGRATRTTLGETRAISLIAISADGSRIISDRGIGLSPQASPNNTLYLWNAADGAMERTLHALWGDITAVTFSPDGGMVDGTAALSVPPNNSARVMWDANSGDTLSTVSLAPKSGRPVAFAPNKRLILSIGDHPDQKLRVLDATTGTVVRTFDGDAGSASTAVFSADGSRVLLGDIDGTLRLWDVASGKMLHSFNGRIRPVVKGQEDYEEGSEGISAVALSPDGRWILAGNNDGTLGLWDATDGKLLRTFEGPATERQDQGHFDRITAVAVSPDGRTVLSAAGPVMRLWEADSGRLVRAFEGHNDDVYTAVFAADGRFIVSGSSDGSVRIWRADSGEQLASLISMTNDQGNDSWIALVPEGFYAASSRGAAGLNLVRGLDVIGLDQAHETLHRPDLVRERLAGDSKGLVRQAAMDLNFDAMSKAAARATAEFGGPKYQALPRQIRNRVEEIRAVCRDMVEDSVPKDAMQGILDVYLDQSRAIIIDNEALCTDHMPGANCSNRGCDLSIWRLGTSGAWQEVLGLHAYGRTINIDPASRRLRSLDVGLYAGDPRCKPRPGKEYSSGQACSLTARYQNGKWVWQRRR